MIFPFGPLVNAILVIVGSTIGIVIGSRLPERVREIVFQSLGLCTLVIGMSMALETSSPIILILSLLLGGILGELINLEGWFTSLGDLLKSKIKSANPKFTQGIVNSSVIFCVGALAIIGSFEEALNNDLTIVYSKSILDFFCSIALASAYGIGVIFSSIIIFIYQGLLVLFASSLEPIFTDKVMTELTATGGAIVLGIGFNLLNITNLRLSNFIPALLFAVLLSTFFL